LRERVRERGIKSYSIHPPLNPLPSKGGEIIGYPAVSATGRFIVEHKS